MGGAHGATQIIQQEYSKCLLCDWDKGSNRLALRAHYEQAHPDRCSILKHFSTLGWEEGEAGHANKLDDELVAFWKRVDFICMALDALKVETVEDEVAEALSQVEALHSAHIDPIDGESLLQCAEGLVVDLFTGPADLLAASVPVRKPRPSVGIVKPHRPLTPSR